jgi:hypothetical protein
VVSSLAYPNLLENKRLGCCCCIGCALLDFILREEHVQNSNFGLNANWLAIYKMFGKFKSFLSS